MPSNYERKKESARDRSAAESRAGRDIGAIPPVADSERKARARASFQFFCEAYFPERFPLAWSPDHLRVIGEIEHAVKSGGLRAFAMPRGSGKTTICECAVLWAILSGWHPYVFLVGSSEDHALQMLANLKTELENNERLAADYPEACHPIRCLEGQARRCIGQLHHGQPTRIGWTADGLTMPSIPGSRASGAIIRVAGLTGNLRGAKHTRPDGKSVRPSLVIVDDPQTDQSARSPSQCAHREAILAGAVLGLAGPGRKIAGVMPCTVIRPGDMADNVLTREKHPEWRGIRTKLVYEFPTNAKHWDRYGELRVQSLEAYGDLRLATAYYAKHRQAMDKGAQVAWPERFNPDELSAIQHAQNLLLQDRAAFAAEYQNEPLATEEEQAGADALTADQIAGKLNGLAAGDVPIGCDVVTAFIDVQQKVLFWSAVAWESSFTGYVLGYGTWPDQRRPYFTLRDAKRTIAMMSKGTGFEGALYAALESLSDELLGREWLRDDGARLRIDRCLIDANWGQSTDVVYQFCRQSQHAATLTPSHGRGVGASSLPFAEYRRKRGDRVGHNWRMPSVAGRKAVRHVIYDTNYWKSFLAQRWQVAIGDGGCLSLFGRDRAAHRLYAEHLSAEYAVPTQGRGRQVDEWKLRPDRTENHWLDCTVGCAVAAAMQGAALEESQKSTTAKRQRRSFAALQHSKQMRRARA